MKTLITAAAIAAGLALAMPAVAQESAPGTSAQTGAAANNAMSHGAMSNDAMSNGAMSDKDSMGMKKPSKKMAMKKHTDSSMGMSDTPAMGPNASGVNGGNNTNTNTTAGH